MKKLMLMATLFAVFGGIVNTRGFEFSLKDYLKNQVDTRRHTALILEQIEKNYNTCLDYKGELSIIDEDGNDLTCEQMRDLSKEYARIKTKEGYLNNILSLDLKTKEDFDWLKSYIPNAKTDCYNQDETFFGFFTSQDCEEVMDALGQIAIDHEERFKALEENL